jgi:carbon-monoxide dehydrogenase small subunit
MTLHSVGIKVNGLLRAAVVPSHMTLLQFLREIVRITGVKDGCAEGDCGACTVIFNGRAVKSCLILAAQADGAEVLTIESLKGPEGELHPIQNAFMELGAVQCGYCTPGMIMTASALLDANPRPTREEIRASISGNLCRCTGYSKIVSAIELAAIRIASLKAGDESCEICGKGKRIRHE